VTTENPVSLNVTGTPPYNPFIIVNEERGREVHLADYPPTSLANIQYLGLEHDDSNIATGKYYKTQNNLPWGIDTPIPFDYPVEKAQIINTHLKFATWAESGGIVYTDWYENLTGYRNSGNVFQIPN
jgi:LruC domain-containing protein